MPRILHLADLHLGHGHSYLGRKAPRRKQDAIELLERIVDWALEPSNDIAAVLIAGDLFDSHNPPSDLAGVTVAALSRLPQAGKALITVPGNHDEYSYPTCVYRRYADDWPGVLVTTPEPRAVTSFPLGENTCTVFSMAYTSGLSPSRLDDFPTLIDEHPAAGEIRIALLHGTIDVDPSDRTYRIDSAALRRAHIAYAALGHIHKPDAKEIGQGLAVYPGTLNSKGFDDPPVHHLTVVHFEGARPVVEKVPFETRRVEVRRLETTASDTTRSISEKLAAMTDPSLILKVVLEGTRPPEGIDTDYLEASLSDRFFHLEIEDRTQHLAPEDLVSLASQPTIRGTFVKMMLRRIETAKGREREVARMALEKGLEALADAAR